MWYFCNMYGSSADDGHSVKNMLDSIFFTRLFVSERKQIAMIADEKSPTRISHRIFATSRSEMRYSVNSEDL